jgi:hypothetical protein
MPAELVKCDCCGASMSERAAACPICGDFNPRARGHERFAWLVVFLISIPSVFGAFWALLVDKGISAPQQCAVIAGCIAFTVIPYCYARAVEKF